MDRTKPARVPIDATLFSRAFNRDVDFHDNYPQSVYVDKETGEIFWVYKEDEDAYADAGIPVKENAKNRRQIAADPERFLEIPGRTHGEHHDLPGEFLASEWTEDASLREQARAAFFGSIGGGLKAAPDPNIVDAFYEFRDRRLGKKAANFLREHGLL